MKQLCVLACVLFFSRSVVCLTNQEFYEIALAYVTDDGSVERFEDADNDVCYDENDDAIELPGGPDDEVDIEYLIKRMSFTPDKDTDSNQGVSWRHRRHRHHRHRHHRRHRHRHRRHHRHRHHRRHRHRRRHCHRHRRRHRHRHHRRHRHHHHHKRAKSGCHCHKLGCSCCISKSWKVRVFFKKLKFRLNACIGVSYLPRNKGFRVYFKLNGHKVFNKEISLRHPPSLCYGIPGFKRFAKVCLEIYNVDLRQKRLCARITGKLDLKFKRFKVHLKLGCFRIPLAQEDALESLLGDKDLFLYDEQAPEALDFLLTLSDVISDDFIPVFPLMAEVYDVKLSQTAIQQSEVNNRDEDETENPIDQMLSMEVTDEYRKLRKDLVSDPTLFAENESEPLESSEDEQNLLDNTLRFE